MKPFLHNSPFSYCLCWGGESSSYYRKTFLTSKTHDGHKQQWKLYVLVCLHFCHVGEKWWLDGWQQLKAKSPKLFIDACQSLVWTFSVRQLHIYGRTDPGFVCGRLSLC